MVIMSPTFESGAMYITLALPESFGRYCVRATARSSSDPLRLLRLILTFSSVANAISRHSVSVSCIADDIAGRESISNCNMIRFISFLP